MSDAPVRVATDPLGAIRVELVNAARRRSAARRRRRRLGVAAMTLAMSFVLVAGAGALIGGSTGVSTIDDFLEDGSAPSSVSPGMGGPGSGLHMRAIQGDDTTAIAYVSRDGFVCPVIQEPHGEGAGEAREGWGCIAPAALSRGLAGGAAYLVAVRAGERTYVNGFATKDVTTLGLAGPGGPFEVELGEPWEPRLDDLPTVRPFVAVGQDRAIETALPAKVYAVKAHLADGRDVEVLPSRRSGSWRGG